MKNDQIHLKSPLTGAIIEELLMGVYKGEITHFDQHTRPHPSEVTGPIWIDQKLYWSDGVEYTAVSMTAYDLAKKHDPSIVDETAWLQSLEGPTGPKGAMSTVPGPKGDIGPTGLVGPQGIEGPVGAASILPGPKGDKGDTGDTGSQGITGKVGIDGPIGLPGIDGVDGAVGAKGDKGIDGIDGAEGLQGPAGIGINLLGSANTADILLKTPAVIGDSWISLDTGVDSVGKVVAIKDILRAVTVSPVSWVSVGPLQGPEGAQGVTGIQGPIGDVGPKGDKGLTGLIGATGPIGLPGIDGTDGIDSVVPGPEGIKGDTGDQGAIGLTGPIGTPGIDGTNGIDGINGVDGVDGADSTVPGPEGIQGLTGDTGDIGVEGPMGPEGARGIKGQSGLINSFTNVAEMQADTFNTVGDFISTEGYDTPGDGGNNRYEIVPLGTGTTDNGAFINLVFHQAKALFPDSELSVKMWGAKGDNVTDDYPAIQAALTFVGKISDTEWNGAKLRFPSGIYRMSQKAVCHVAKASQGHGNGTPGVRIYGDGKDNTYLVATTSNTTGLIECVSDGNSELWEIDNLSFLSTLAETSGGSNGIALAVSSNLAPGAGGWGVHDHRTVNIHDVYIGGYGDTVTARHTNGRFSKGVYLKNKWWVWLNHLFIKGCVSHGIHTVDCYSPEFIAIQVLGKITYGIKVEGQTYEDFRLQDSFLVGQEHAFTVEHVASHKTKGLYEPGGAISNCHMAPKGYGIHLKYHRQVIISGCYFYVSRGTAAGSKTGNQASIWLEGAEDIVISSCQFLEPGFYVNDSNCSVAIRGTYRAQAMVSGCLFNHGGIGILADAGCNGHLVVTDSLVKGVQVGAAWNSFKKYVDNALEIISFSYNNIQAGQKYTEHVIESSFSGAGGTIRTKQICNRTDYASNKSPELTNRRVAASSSNGAITDAFVEVVHWLDNTVGKESAILKYYVKSLGVMANILSLDGRTKTLNIQGNLTVNGQPIAGGTNAIDSSGVGWIKYSDGTMQQYGSIVNATSAPKKTTFPQSFMNTGYSVTCQSTHNSAHIAIQVTGKTVTGFNTWGMQVKTGGWGGTDGDYIAIGKWK